MLDDSQIKRLDCALWSVSQQRDILLASAGLLKKRSTLVVCRNARQLICIELSAGDGLGALTRDIV